MQFRFHAVNEKFAHPDDPNFFTGAEFYLLNGLITLNDICKKSKKNCVMVVDELSDAEKWNCAA